ncbi:MAG TPA: hypothetical protein VGJ00_10505 [Rhabdochlamydiaceae bacterium]|jgi:hypothetical protein
MWNNGEELHVIGKLGGSKAKGLHKSDRKCSFEGCTNAHRAKGWCSNHYNQITKYGAPHKAIPREKAPNDKKCSVKDCQEPYKCKGYCLKHYTRWMANGTPELLPKILVRKECRHYGCTANKRTQGYCYKHYREIVLKIPSTRLQGNGKRVCDVDDCENLARSKGMCDKHYQRTVRYGDPLTSYRRPRKSNYVSVDNIMNLRGTYSKSHDAEVLREHFSDVYKIYDKDDYY